MPNTAFHQPHSAVASHTVARIRVRGVTKKFRRHGGGGEIIPVNNVTLDVSRGEMLVLLGPSGCGKTTLLRCVAGLEKPDAGEIYINDELVFSSRKGVSLPPNRRPVSMVFQSYALWPHMTLFDNVAYPLRARGGVTEEEVRRRSLEVLETVELATLSRQYPGQISGGQQQRVALARAVVSQTGVVLFDEPLSNVDAKVREQLRLEIRRMQRAFGFTALYVTHDQSEAMAVADRIAVLGDGVIEQLGTAEEIYNLPTSPYIGTFIGAANIWRGRVSAADASSIRFCTDFGELTVTPSADAMKGSPAPAVGQPAMLLARPESVMVHPTRPAGRVNLRECTVEARIFLGSHTEYVLLVGKQRIRAWIPSISSIEEGATAWWSVSPDRLRILRDGAVSSAG